MTKLIIAIICILGSITVGAQTFKTISYGQNILSGKVILKNLRHPINGTIIKNAMLLKLPQKLKFKAEMEDEMDVVTDEIRIYGDVIKNIDPNKKYKALINRQVVITANIVYAPSPYYPVLVNIIEDFKYKIK